MQLVYRILREHRPDRPAALHADSGMGLPLCGTSQGGYISQGYVECQGEPTCTRCIRLLQRDQRISSSGYILVYDPSHPIAPANGYVLAHRKVWYDAHGTIPEGHVIHHINRNKTDNRLENLACLSFSEHGHEHLEETFPKLSTYWKSGGTHLRDWAAQNNGPWNKGTTEYVELECPYCGASFVRAAHQKRQRDHDGSALYCSRRCSTAYKNRKSGKTKTWITEFMQSKADEWFTIKQIAEISGMRIITVQWGLNQLLTDGLVIQKPAPKGKLLFWSWNTTKGKRDD